MPLASITSFVGDHGVYAVFALMIVAAVLPAASELVMVYAGAMASGAFASAHVVLFGHRVSTHAWAYVTLAVAGVLGNTLGALLGWLLGAYGGRPFLARYGRWLHATPERLERAERWLERYEKAAVPVGLATPGLRSFVALPAGVVGLPLARFLALAVVGITVFCFGLAGGGWALGSSYDRLHHDLTYVEIAVGIVVVAVVAYAIFRRRSTTLARRADDSSH